MEFKDRTQESKKIEQILSSKAFEFLILYGRRRIGKTELVLHTTKNKKRIYYLATGAHNLDRFYEVCKQYDPQVLNLKKDYEVLFEYLKDKVDVIIIDEFQNLISEDKNIVHLFQSIVDTKLKKSNLKLILLGSSVSIMTSKVLSYQSPLYARKTASMKLGAVSFLDLPEFFPKFDFEQLVEIYGFADGIPYYLIKLNQPFWDWLKEELKQSSSFFHDEVDFLMKYEFDDPSTYKVILEAIANGKTKISEIKDFVKLSRTDISPYLKNLLEVDLIKREVPITENVKSRNGRYSIKDNFIKFWFKFIYPQLSSVETGIFDTAQLKKEYPSYLGFIFEEISKQYLLKLRPINFNKLGRWWWKDQEIDIVGLNDSTKEMLICECKWQSNVDACKILAGLEEKEKNVDWNNEKRKVIYAVFAKSFKNKVKEFNGKQVFYYDIKDLEKI
ncbi:MAG: ATP-binding protein [Nanoarchaeota archaeon]